MIREVTCWPPPGVIWGLAWVIGQRLPPAVDDLVRAVHPGDRQVPPALAAGQLAGGGGVRRVAVVGGGAEQFPPRQEGASVDPAPGAEGQPVGLGDEVPPVQAV